MQPVPLDPSQAIDLGTVAFNLTVVLLLVAANGFFVAAEFSLVSVRQTRVDQLVEQGHRIAPYIQRAKADPNRYLSASQIGITLASLALGWVAEPTVASLLMALMHKLGLVGALSLALLHSVALVTTFVIITYMHIVLGEFIPKAMALQRTEPTVLATTLPLEVLATLFTPFIHVLNRSGQWMLDRMGIQAAPHHHLVYTEDELKRIVSASHEVGILEAQEQEMLHKVFAFSDRRVRELMVPRPDMITLPVTASWADVVKLVCAEQHTRIPVYEETIDNILGVLHTKDLFPFMGEVKDTASFHLRELLRTVPFVPESKPVDDLMTEMKKSRTQMAIVMDEFGGTAGLISLEDLLEELVGEIEDEFDEPEHEVIHLGGGGYSLDGKMRIADFNERFGTELPTLDYDTMAGLVFGMLGREPAVGDLIAVERAHFMVETMEGHRITRLKLELKASEETPPPEEAVPPGEP
ncbi:MAG: hemolysin family protein [Candidatus Sericytochromatia bacterium]|nr:hemolysin family protein [Candidatus Sericytochromatia bacterium]